MNRRTIFGTAFTICPGSLRILLLSREREGADPGKNHDQRQPGLSSLRHTSTWNAASSRRSKPYSEYGTETVGKLRSPGQAEACPTKTAGQQPGPRRHD
jgi:hypothetical protein